MKAGFDARGSFTALALISAVAVTVQAAPALAQGAAAAPDNNGEIIVTAQRRSERLEEVPLSVTALSGNDLAKANVASFRDIETVTPGVRISSTGVFTQPAIRGITSTAIGPGIENNIAFYVDGFYQPDNSALGSDFANVAGVQILKGPQGTLYGRNALGGAFLVSTRDPSLTDGIVVDGDATYGSRNDVRLRGYISAKLTDNLALGIAGYYRRNDGYLTVTDATANQPVVNTPLPNYITPNKDGKHAAPFRNAEIRAKLRWDPSSDFSLTLGYNHLYKFNPTAITYTMSGHPYLTNTLSPPALGSPALAQGMDIYGGSFNPDFHTKQDEGTVKVSWKLPFGELNSYTNYIDLKPYFDSDYDGSSVNFLRIASAFQRQTFNENFDFTTKPVDRLSLTLGGMYYNDRGSSETWSYSLGSLLGGGSSKSRLKSQAYAVFGDATWEVVDGLFLNAGIRYSYEEKLLTSTILTALAPGNNVVRGNFDDLTPRFSIRYEIAPRTNVYASYSQGFKSGTFNSLGQSLAAQTTPVQPEKINAYEAGFKTASHGVQFDVAGYYYDYKNLQVNSLVAVGTGSAPTITNAATARIYGAEAQLSARPIEHLNVRLGGAWTHARYRDFKNASVLLLCTQGNGQLANSGAVPAAPGSCPFPNGGPGAQITQDFSGIRMSRSPDWTFSAAADYTIPVGDGNVVLAGNVSYSSSYAPTIETYDPVTKAPRFYQEAYATASASITYNLAGDHFWVRGFVDNLTDQRFRIVANASGRGEYFVYSEPRRFGATVGFRY